jgi:hypothetical protein
MMRLVVVAALCAAIGAAVVPAAFAVYPDPGGGDVYACGNNGTTPSWSGINEVYTPVCLSYRTSFYAYVPNYATNCYSTGYTAEVVHVDDSNNYYDRWDGWFCDDGLWHWSSAWGYSERRFSSMRINAGGVDWAMFQWTR